MTVTPTIPVDIPAQRPPRAADRLGARPGDEKGSWPLVELAKAGDREAFAELYRLYQPLVFGIAYRRLPDRCAAEDVASQVWIKVINKIPTVEWRGRDFGAWLVTVTRNQIADYWKAGYNRRETLTPGGDWNEQYDRPDTSEDIEANLIARDLEGATRTALRAAMAHMSPGQCEVIRLRFSVGLNVAETAAAMGLPVSNVKALQYRAVQALRRHFPGGRS